MGEVICRMFHRDSIKIGSCYKVPIYRCRQCLRVFCGRLPTPTDQD